MFIVLALVLSVAFFTGAMAVPIDTNTTVQMPTGLFLFNPYRNVDFATFGRYKADFHVHTSNSDGTSSPDETARRFASVGFDFLAIAEHDNWVFGRHNSRPGVTIGDNGNATAGDPVIPNFNQGSNTNEWVQTWPWQRFGVASNNHGLIPIQANEATRTQHFGMFYTSFTDRTGPAPEFAPVTPLSANIGPSNAGGKRAMMERAIEHSSALYPCDRDGIIEPIMPEGQIRFEIFHPERDLSGGRLDFAAHLAHLDRPAVNGVYPWISAGYYQELIHDFPTILSMEVFNQADRHPSRHIYDRIMRGMFPGRPVWLSANSDEHGIHFGRSANIMLLENRSEHNFRRAREQGAYFAVSFGEFDPNLLELDRDYHRFAGVTTNSMGHHWHYQPHLPPRLSTQRWGDRWNYVPRVQDIIVDNVSGLITIQHYTYANVYTDANIYTEVVWFTEDRRHLDIDCNIVGRGNTINFRTNQYISNFVRGELRNYMYIDDQRVLISTKLLQPFGVGEFDADSWFFHFSPFVAEFVVDNNNNNNGCGGCGASTTRGNIFGSAFLGLGVVGSIKIGKNKDK